MLPVLAALVLASYFISSSLSVTVGDMTASISGVEVTDGTLRMTNPKLKGADKKNGAYVISAEYADQDLKSPNSDQASRHQGRSLHGRPATGRACRPCAACSTSEAERLVMQEKITVATSSGVTGELTHASLDTKKQTLRAHQRVHFELTNGTVKANALTFNSAEHTLTFRGKVLVHIVKPAEGSRRNADDANRRRSRQRHRKPPTVRLSATAPRGRRRRARRPWRPTCRRCHQ